MRILWWALIQYVWYPHINREFGKSTPDAPVPPGAVLLVGVLPHPQTRVASSPWWPPEVLKFYTQRYEHSRSWFEYQTVEKENSQPPTAYCWPVNQRIPHYKKEVPTDHSSELATSVLLHSPAQLVGIWLHSISWSCWSNKLSEISHPVWWGGVPWLSTQLRPLYAKEGNVGAV
jgi:hypothetical protein